ncbi:MAG TPA: molybdopterin-dependent oxidoreductase [Anaerolineaceae bacterium]
MVNITIDGKTVEVPEGTTVLRAAEMAGITIPTLCDHKELLPYGGCRLCVVEVEGARTLQPSCTLPASNHMVVHTDTDKVVNARKFVLTLLFSERNHFCMFCQVSGGDCELQNAAYHEGMTHWPLQPNWQGFPVDASHPYIIMENNRCILCRRCVRACGELVGNFTLGFEERGAKSNLVADYGVPLGESTCISCGACVQICPTGAIIDRQSAYHGRDTQVEHTGSICTGCSVGCGIEVLTRDNHLVRIDGDWDAKVNGGVLCKTGRFIQLDEKRERIMTPMVRKDGALKAATWNEAVAVIAEHLKPLAGKAGGGVAAAASSRLSAEALHLFKQIFADGLHSDRVSSLEAGQATITAANLAKEHGKPYEGSLDALKSADCVLTVGLDLTKEHEVAGFFIKRSLPNGVKLVVANAKPTGLDNLADGLLVYGKANPRDVLQGLLAGVAQLGLSKTAIKPALALDTAAARTGIAADSYLAAAKILASAAHPAIIFGRDLEKPAVAALIDLAQVTGAIDEAHSALISVKGQANSIAAAQYQLNQPFKANGRQAVFIALGDDDPGQKLIQAFEKAPFLAVQATYVSQLTAKADVILPVANWAEEDGHFVNMEGRIQQALKAIVPPANVLSNEASLQALAAKLGILPANTWKEALTRQAAVVAIA